jgi:hypothetical protein
VISAAGTALIVAGLANVPPVRSQSASPPQVRLRDEAAGLDAIVRTLITAFDQADIVALDEWHGRIRLDSDLRM